MVDRSKKMQRSELENTVNKAASSDDLSEGIDVKICVDCGTSRTPLWRSGPAGPKSLCNACGIKSRKKKRPSIQGLNKVSVSVEDKRSKISLSNSIAISKSVAALGNGVTRKRSNVEKLRRKMIGDEEEQAAFLLMALSCGTVYAY